MSDPIRVTVRRGNVVESVHRVHAVAVQAGAVVAEFGNAGMVAFMRSAAKPIQALPLARARADLDDRDLAIASASHRADDAQLGAVRALLAKAPAEENELECGEEGEPPARIKHNCSGKHAGMLALCRAHGWPCQGYRLAEHPVQRSMLAEVSRVTDVAEREIPTAVDGCGVVTFALPLERMAYAFARLPAFEEGARVLAAMRRYPELIRGGDAPDTRLMRALDGWASKGGAEGLHCAVGPGGLGIALKVEDGTMRAIPPALATLVARLGYELDGFARVPLRNSRGETVGDISLGAPDLC